MNPAISIVIRTFNSAGMLDAVLSRLARLPGDELIIVDSGSTDATLALAGKWNAQIIRTTGAFNYSRSLNLGFAAAKNPWVLALSSHCLPLSDSLVETFRQAAQTFPATVALAYGECAIVDRKNTATAAVFFADQTSPPAQRLQVYTGNSLALYRRAAWERRPFDETLPTGEDMAWFLGALADGAVAARVPSARVLYRNQGSLRHMFRKGWLESRQLIWLAGSPAPNLWQLGINWGSLLKKWGTGKIPAGTLLRQGAHALGAWLSPKFSGRHQLEHRTKP